MSEGFPCGSIISLVALGEGSGWDLRVRPLSPPAPAQESMENYVSNTVVFGSGVMRLSPLGRRLQLLCRWFKNKVTGRICFP